MNFLRPNLIYNISKRSISSTQSLLAHWNKDWKPGKFPQTEEERIAAAKKYNLFPEEYEPVPDDGHGAGDYPGFKPYSVESRNPFYPWDYPEYRRNYGEAMHEDMNWYGEDRYDVLMKPRFGIPTMLCWFLSVMGLSTFLMYACKDTQFLPVMPQHIPKPGVKHYTYE